MSKVALITGVTGQDGAYLAEFLLLKGYTVHGIRRRSSLFKTDRIDHLYRDPHSPDCRFFLHYGDLTDATALIRIIQQTQPDEIYNLAAQSHVAVSFEEPEYTANSDALGPLRLLEAMRILGLRDRTRFYQAPRPSSTATCAKLRSGRARRSIRARRTASRSSTATGLPSTTARPTVLRLQRRAVQSRITVRGETFVTRKITRALARIKLGLQERLHLGNLHAKRIGGTRRTSSRRSG
jgi:GDPmannose 4,6-dehydratase